MLAEAHNGELLGQMCPNVCPDFQWIVGCRAGCSKRKSFRFGHPGTEQIQQLHRLENTVALLFLSGQMGSASQNAWVQGVPDRAMHTFFAAIFRLTLRVSSLIPREEQTAARLSLAALASTAIKMPPRFPLYRHQAERGTVGEQEDPRRLYRTGYTLQRLGHQPARQTEKHFKVERCAAHGDGLQLLVCFRQGKAADLHPRHTVAPATRVRSLDQ